MKVFKTENRGEIFNTCKYLVDNSYSLDKIQKSMLY